MQDILLQFGIICSIGTIYLRTEGMEDKRKYLKTIYIIEKGNGSSIERKTRRNQHLLEIKWNFEALCHSVIRQAKKQYNNFTQQICQKEKCIQPRYVQPKISSISEREPLQLEDEKTVNLNVHPDILKADDLIFNGDRIHPVSHCAIPISNNFPINKQKLLIVIAALHLVYKVLDSMSICHLLCKW